MSCTYTRSKIGEGRGKKNFFPPQTVNANWGNILIVLSEQVRNSSPQERVAHDLKGLLPAIFPLLIKKYIAGGRKSLFL